MFRVVSVVVAALLAAAGIHATVTATAPAAPGGTAVVLVLFVAAMGFWLGRKFSRASAEAHATAIANARAAALAKATAEARAQQLVIVNTSAPMEAPLYVEGDSWDGDVDIEEVEGGDGERAQASSGALPRPAPDPYAVSRSLPPRTQPIAASRASGDESVNPHPLTETSSDDPGSAGAVSTFPSVDGFDGEAMMGRRLGAGSPVFDQWPFTQDHPLRG